MVEFYQNKDFERLELLCTLPSMANICLHRSTSAKFYPFTESQKDFLWKVCKDMVGGLSIVLTGKTVVDETQLRKLAKACKSIFGMGAIQIYPYPMCRPVPTGLYTRYEFGAELKRLKSRHNKPRSFEKMVRSFFQRMRQDWGIESFYPTGTQKEIDCFSADGFCVQFNPVFETMGSSYHFCSCHEAPSALTEEDIQRGTEKGNAEAVYRGEFTLFSKCGNVIGGNSTRLMSQKRNTWENLSHTTVQCVRNSYWKRGNQAHCLFTYIVISRFQNIKEINLQTPRHFGKRLPCVDKMLHRRWRSMLKRKGVWPNRGEC